MNSARPDAKLLFLLFFVSLHNRFPLREAPGKPKPLRRMGLSPRRRTVFLNILSSREDSAVLHE